MKGFIILFQRQTSPRGLIIRQRTKHLIVELLSYAIPKLIKLLKSAKVNMNISKQLVLPSILFLKLQAI
ncbi:hypothetical protein AGRI_01885 [Alishewanella agri BL06]|uniref:Uncharacterized protein n=1 Tax=Alishewanella agri BL06 TaxID=1195246 RepID=I9DWI6_9ALTE|nr:hypothetical protein AGRI_01885 [Alishewanella agri BL06]OCW96066.1 hypothetical protein A9165_13500 [Alishewanella sp. HH-ZS]